ncbi:hypothetical protein ADL03_35465 [Nocardia sp. NRRL S-836]|nr:hypothetical protein ADL03_35465 [Nocardia sp. NRRL S-836]
MARLVGALSWADWPGSTTWGFAGWQTGSASGVGSMDRRDLSACHNRTEPTDLGQPTRAHQLGLLT